MGEKDILEYYNSEWSRHHSHTKYFGGLFVLGLGMFIGGIWKEKGKLVAGGALMGLSAWWMIIVNQSICNQLHNDIEEIEHSRFLQDLYKDA